MTVQVTNKSTGNDIMVLVGRDIMITEDNPEISNSVVSIWLSAYPSLLYLSCIQIFLGHKQNVLHPPLEVDQLNWQAQPAQIGTGGRWMGGGTVRGGIIIGAIIKTQ